MVLNFLKIIDFLGFSGLFFAFRGRTKKIIMEYFYINETKTFPLGEQYCHILEVTTQKFFFLLRN